MAKIKGLIRKNVFRSGILPLWIGTLFFSVFSVAFWMKVADHGWICIGDTLDDVVFNSFQVSSFFRGEYFLWNPLIRCGQNETTLQLFLFANPLKNFVNASFVLVHSHDMVVVYATFIYIMAILYAGGTALLITALTKNLNAGIFVFILTLSSSAVLTWAEEWAFLAILFSVPWMIYSLFKYLLNHQFHYLLLFFLAFCIFIYSYEAPLGMIFFFVLSCAGLIVYRKDLPVLFDRIKKIPRKHIVVACVLFILFSLPMGYMIYEYKTEILPISRLSHIALNNQYGLQYTLEFFKNHISPLTSKKLWPALLTGFTCDNYILLRHYLIPIAAPFLLLAIINMNQLVSVLLLTGLGMSLFSGNIFPANLFLRLPVFNSIHNLHFLVQYVLLVFILLAGLGFDILSKKWSLAIKKSMNGIIISFLCFCVLLGFLIPLFPGYQKQNIFAVVSSILTGFFLWAGINFISDRRRDLVILILATVIALSALFMMNNFVPIIGGWKTQNREMLALHDRTDHSLKFLYERPDIVQTMDINHWSVDFGLAEETSYLSLKDNSFGQPNYSSGMSSLPYMKSTYLFLLLPGHEVLSKNKFFFFDRVVNSYDPRDMMAFKRDPDLFKKMVDKNIGMISGDSAQQGDTFHRGFSAASH